MSEPDVLCYWVMQIGSTVMIFLGIYFVYISHNHPDEFPCGHVCMTTSQGERPSVYKFVM